MKPWQRKFCVRASLGINAVEEFPLPWESVVGTLGRMKAISRYGTELPYAPPQPIAYIVDKGAFNSALATQATDAGALLHISTRACDLAIDDDGVYTCTRWSVASNRSECMRSWPSWRGGCTIT
jgi:flavin-dependent dehydrogenase